MYNITAQSTHLEIVKEAKRVARLKRTDFDTAILEIDKELAALPVQDQRRKNLVIFKSQALNARRNKNN